MGCDAADAFHPQMGAAIGGSRSVPHVTWGQQFIGPGTDTSLINGPKLCLYWLGQDDSGAIVVLGRAQTDVNAVGKGTVPEGAQQAYVRSDAAKDLDFWVEIDLSPE